MKIPFPKVSFKNPVFIVASIFLVLLVIWWAKVAFMVVMMSRPRPPVVVSTALATLETWPHRQEVVAALKSKNGTFLKAENSGVVKEIAVEANQSVRKGDLLLAIDADSERAAAKLAKLTYERAKELREKSVNTQNDLDQAEAAYAKALAELDKKDIRAPFDGVVGVPQVFLGQYVTPGMTLLAIEDNSVIYADSGVAQGSVAGVKLQSGVTLTVDAFPGERFEGTVVGVDPRLSENTLTAMVRAVFPNPEGKLLSGMFGTLSVRLEGQEEGFSLPATAIVYSAYGNFVYVTASRTNEKTKATEKIVKQTFVKILAAQGDFVLVGGLNDGDEVVIAGQLKLKNGTPISVDNSRVPPVSKTPTPLES